MSRVIMPRNPDGMLELIGAIIKQEDALGADAVLTKDELNELKAYYADASEARKSMLNHYGLAEQQTKIYENILGINAKVNQPGNAQFIYTMVRNVLVGKNKTNLKRLLDWGFDVVDEVAKKKPKAP